MQVKFIAHFSANIEQVVIRMFLVILLVFSEPEMTICVNVSVNILEIGIFHAFRFKLSS